MPRQMMVDEDASFMSQAYGKSQRQQIPPASWPGLAVRRTASLRSPTSRPSRLGLAWCVPKRYGRHKAGHDVERAMTKTSGCLPGVMTMQPQRQFAPDIVEVRRHHVARARQRDLHLAFDPPRPRRHHHHAVGEKYRLLDGMRHEQHRQPGALPDLQEFVLQSL